MTTSTSRRQLLKFAGAFMLAPVLPACGPMQVPILSGRTMGTRYRVQLERVPKGTSLPVLKHEIETILETTESRMSLHRPDSELSLINVLSPGLRHRLSPNTGRVIERGLQIMRLSDGAYNPAAGPLVDYWGFGSELKLTPSLEQSVPVEIADSVSTSVFELDHEIIRKHHAQAALNLNAIAKGDAVDQLARMLEQRGIVDFMIEVGGEIYARGSGPRGDRWWIGIEHPDGGTLTTVNIDRQAIATSGDYIHFTIEQGRRISHLINPKTARPVSDRLALVSVVSDYAIDADAWATALMVMGPDEGLRFALQNNIAAVFLKREAGGYKAVRTPLFKSIETVT